MTMVDVSGVNIVPGLMARTGSGALGTTTFAMDEAADPASNTQVNTRLATSGYTSPDNTSITAIKAKTDTIAWQDVTDIKDAGLGKWSINKYTNVLTMYKANGVTVLKQFNLIDTASVSERVPV